MKKGNYCWILEGGKLIEAVCPYEEDGDLYKSLAKAGYISEITSQLEDTFGRAEVTLFQNENPANGNPLFYIDVWGSSHGLGAMVAHDFGQLVETMNHLSGLLSLIKLSQSVQISELICEQLIP